MSEEVEVILNPNVNPFYVTATNMIVHIDTISILIIKNILETIIITISNIFDSNIFNLILAIMGLIVILSNIYTTIVVVYNLYKI